MQKRTMLHLMAALACASAAMLLRPCSAAPKQVPVGILAKAELGPQAVSILSGATRVEAFRIDSSRDNAQDSAKASSNPTILGYKITATGKEQGAVFASRLASVLLDDRAYQGIGDLCMFQPAIALRAWHGQEYINIVICLHCGDIVLDAIDASGKTVSETFPRFYTIAPQLTPLLKEAFPEDRLIQGLPIGHRLSAAQFAQHAYPVLTVAARRGYTDVVHAAIARGDNVNVVFDSETPLGVAVSGNHMEIVKMLIAAGANVNLKSAGLTPLEHAQNQPDEMTQFLLVHGARK